MTKGKIARQCKKTHHFKTGGKKYRW